MDEKLIECSLAAHINKNFITLAPAQTQRFANLDLRSSPPSEAVLTLLQALEPCPDDPILTPIHLTAIQAYLRGVNISQAKISINHRQGIIFKYRILKHVQAQNISAVAQLLQQTHKYINIEWLLRCEPKLELAPHNPDIQAILDEFTTTEEIYGQVRPEGLYTPHLAAKMGNVKLVALLLHYGLPIDYPDKYGNTLLMIAKAYGHCQLSRHLIIQGANLSAKNHGNKTLFMQTCEPEATTTTYLCLAACVTQRKMLNNQELNYLACLPYYRNVWENYFSTQSCRDRFKLYITALICNLYIQRRLNRDHPYPSDLYGILKQNTDRQEITTYGKKVYHNCRFWISKLIFEVLFTIDREYTKFMNPQQYLHNPSKLLKSRWLIIHTVAHMASPKPQLTPGNRELPRLINQSIEFLHNHTRPNHPHGSKGRSRKRPFGNPVTRTPKWKI